MYLLSVRIFFKKSDMGCARVNQKKICTCELGFGFKSLIWARFGFYKTRIELDLLSRRVLVGVGLDNVHFSNLVWPK